MNRFFEESKIPFFVDSHYLEGSFTSLDKIGFEAIGYFISDDKKEFVKIFTGKHLYRQKNTLQMILDAIGSGEAPSFLLLPSKIIKLYSETYAFVYETDETVSDLFNYLGTCDGKLTNPEFKLLIKTLLSAIKWFNKNNLSHRDIKFENILRWKDGSFKLIDYGLIRTIDYTGFGGTAMYLPYVIEKLIVYSDKRLYSTSTLTKLITNEYFKETFSPEIISELKTDLSTIIYMSDIEFSRLFKKVYEKYFVKQAGLYHDLYTLLVMLSMFSHNKLCEDESLTAIDRFLNCDHGIIKTMSFQKLHDKFYGREFSEFLSEIGLSDFNLN